jgi:peptidoglycan/xylan/chitin deacetylase (PgdA/CDA1 family)
MTNAVGVMVLSLDFELSWGRFDKLSLGELDAQSLQERNQIKRLLALLDRYEIPATWATVGHLMLDSCTRDHGGQAHIEVASRPRYSWFSRDWFCFDPCTKASISPAWYAPDIVDWIKGAKVRHEIGSHSFAHIYYGDPECAPSVARADLQAAADAASQKGVSLNSFVFPRNQVGHLQLLKEFGFQAYRGEMPAVIPGARGHLRRVANLLDTLCAVAPKPVTAEEVMPGLWNIPGNHFFMARDGIRKYIPIASRVRKGKKGIDNAVKTGQLYHLWFHPFNLNSDSDAMFSGLEQIFSYACRMREEGRLNILTMVDYARHLEKEKIESSSASLR